MKKHGFTLIELVVVIAILGIIATLAVSRIGNIREKSQRQVSLANQSAISRAVEAFMAANQKGVDRLDSLVDEEVSESSAYGFDVNSTLVSNNGAGFYAGPDDAGFPLPQALSDQNSGLTPNLVNNILIPYVLNEKEVQVLSNFGVRYVMRHTTYSDKSPRAAYNEKGEDGAYLSDDANIGLHPNKSACIATVITNGLVCAAISPFTPLGRTIYRDCGQLLLPTYETAAEYRGVQESVLKEVAATGGALIAFGLGDEATIIGSANGGLESAPYATYPLRKFYTRYILLFRINTTTQSGQLEFAGVLDPCGNTIRVAREYFQ
ncbi:MAG: type II secretion system protein [Kiritimatiellae bacterium]|nr:type II secretion system protein [Kiritimatiellia bacterium]